MTIDLTDNTDRPSVAALLRRAAIETDIFGRMCIDTAALLLSEGIDVTVVGGHDQEEY